MGRITRICIAIASIFIVVISFLSIGTVFAELKPIVVETKGCNYRDTLTNTNEFMTIEEISKNDPGLYYRADMGSKEALKNIENNGTLERIHGIFELKYTPADGDKHKVIYFDKDFNSYLADNDPLRLYTKQYNSSDKKYKTIQINDSQIGVQILEINDVAIKAIVTKVQDSIYVKNGDILVLDKSYLNKLSNQVSAGSILGVKFSGGVSYISHYDISDVYYFECNDIQEVQEVYNTIG